MYAHALTCIRRTKTHVNTTASGDASFPKQPFLVNAKGHNNRTHADTNNFMPTHRVRGIRRRHNNLFSEQPAGFDAYGGEGG